MFRTTQPSDSTTSATSRRRVRTLATSATAALALTAGLALPACAADGDTTPTTVTTETTGTAGSPGTATESTADESSAASAGQVNDGAGETDGRLQEAIELAKAEGHISDDEWVADPSFEIARGEDGDPSAQVITIAGGTGSSPQAVLLYAPGHGKYVATAQVPEDMAGDVRWGDRVGNVKTMGLTTTGDIGVLWEHPDGQSANLTYRYHNGHFEVVSEE